MTMEQESSPSCGLQDHLQLPLVLRLWQQAPRKQVGSAVVVVDGKWWSSGVEDC